MTLNIDTLWDALGWAILHSLWQAALIGLVVWAVRALATQQRAKLRYLAGMTGLVATFIAFLSTFVILIFNRLADVTPTSLAGSGESFPTAATDVTLSVSVLPVQGLQGDLAAYIVPWLGMVWAVGFVFLSLQAYHAWANTRRLATQGLRTPGAEWTHRFVQLLARSQAHQRVRLFVSDHVSGPLTLGTLKPLVLVPAGFLTSMPSAQIEAILLHELAHIRRHDFLFGLIQTAIRTVLYFNPAVLILSRQIDTDREQACDDIAVEVCGRPGDLARGLAALRLGTQAPALTMSADGSPLLARLNRLMGRPVTRESSNRLSAAAISALMLGTATYGTVSMAHPHPGNDPDTPRIVMPDTVVTGRGRDRDRDRDRGSYVVNVDIPAMPVIPPMPVMPPTPVIPPAPPVPAIAYSDYKSGEAFEAAMENWGEKMDAWGETVEARFDDDWEDRMEAWGEEMEVWGEKMDALGEAYDDLDDLSDAHLRDMGLSRQWLEDHHVDLQLKLDLQTQRSHAHAERVADQVEHQQQQIERQIERAERSVERKARLVEREAERAARYASRLREKEARNSRSTHMITATHDAADGGNHTVVMNGHSVDITQMRKRLVDAMVRDGVVRRGDWPAKVAFCTEEMSVNGEVVTEERRLRYMRIIRDAGLVTTDPVKVWFKDDATQIRMSDDDGKGGLTMSFGTPIDDKK